MIKSFRHKGLQRFFEKGSKAGINPQHAKKLTLQLTALHVAARPMDMSVPNWDLHELQPDKSGVWAVTVNGNWRVTFKFDGKDVVLVDYLDYH